MTLCCGLITKCHGLLTALFAGGAFLDYRNRDGLTPLHRAAERGNNEAIKVMDGKHVQEYPFLFVQYLILFNRY